jgi:uncharacterized damage-inducible protein DinB
MNQLQNTLRAALLLLGTLAVPAVGAAQDNPYSQHARYMYAGTKAMLLRAAEKMPAEHYGFRPTEAVRSYGQIIGHAADFNFRFCSAVLGEKITPRNIEKTKSAKTDLIAGLKEALAYCDRAYDSMTDASGAEILNLGHEMPKLGWLTVNSLHNAEHYGNLATYMRIKNIVPPTSEPGFTVEPPKK